METATPRVLVMGCGSIGQRHLGNLQALGVRQIIAYDPRPERRREAAVRFPIDTVEELAQAWAARPTVAPRACRSTLQWPG